uniref:Uncharacterized protein n=1 Tax=Plectus sambesii TaxID=2011161 RepID=A0A914X817_9BILA
MDSHSEQAFINGSPVNRSASQCSTKDVGVGDDEAAVPSPQQQYSFTFPIYHACAHSGNGRNRYVVQEQRASADGLVPQVKMDPPEDGLETVLQLTVAIRPRGMSNEQLKYHLQSCGIKADRLIPAGSVEAAMEQALEQQPSEDSVPFMGERRQQQQHVEPIGNSSEPIVWVEEEEFEPQMDRRQPQTTVEESSHSFRLENPAEISLDDIDERQVNRFGKPMVYHAKKRGR